MTPAGPAGAPEVPIGSFVPARRGWLAANIRLVFALVREWSPLARAVTWIAVTWQRIRTAGGILPSTVTATLADLVGQAPAESKKCWSTPLRAGHRIVGILIRWLVGSTPNSVLRGGRSSSGADSTDQHLLGSWPGRSGSNRVYEPELARGNGSRPETWAKSLRQSRNRDLKINRPSVTGKTDAADTSAADPPLFQGEVTKLTNDARSRPPDATQHA